MLEPKHSGAMFSIATISMLVTSLVFAAIILLLPSALNMTPEQFEGSFLYSLISYGVGSISILLAVLVFCFIHRLRPLSHLPFKKAPAKIWVAAAMMIFGLLFGFSWMNDAFVSILERLGFTLPEMTLPNDEPWQLAVWIIVVAILPAFFEEVLFRGYVLEGLKATTPTFAILVGGAMFALFHQNPQQTVYQFICGVAFFLIAYEGGSIIPGIAMHFVNNFVIILFDYLNVTFSTGAYVALTVLAIISFITSFVIIFEGKRTEKPTVTPVNHTKTPFFFYAAAGIVLCAIMWGANLFSYAGA